MKILVVAKAYPPETGGIETYSEELAKAYDKLGHDVTVLTAHPGASGMTLRGKVAVHNVGPSSQIKVFWRFLNWLRTRQKCDYDFIHATTWRVAIPLSLVRFNAPLAITIHGREVFVVPRILKPIMKKMFASAQLVPTVSQPTLERARRITGMALPQAFANWNGISFELEAAEPLGKPAGFNIFCMCRMVERKNVATAITAVAELVHEGYDVRFDIAGGGEELESLKAHTDAQNTADKIVMHGRIPDEAVPEFYRQAHVFLHPQIATRDGGDMEGFGLTIADGMAFGCVPVAGSSGGPSDFIDHGSTGFLVSGHDVADIKAHLIQLIKNPTKRETLAAQAQQFALKELTWEKHAAKTLDQRNA